jgi:subtilisin family serine protease
MSLGGSGSDDGKSCAQTTNSYKKAICNSVGAGVTYAVAAGNESDDARNHVPAAYAIDGMITVSALADFNGLPGGGAAPTCRADEDDTLANFSNYGPRVDIIAPGVCILSTWNDGGYNTISGTSMASPHVAGAAALYISKFTSRPSPANVRLALVNAVTTDWNNADDKDNIQEPLLNVGGF